MTQVLTFKTQFKATVVTADTKEEAMNKIQCGSWAKNYNWVSTNRTKGLVLGHALHTDNGKIRLFRLQKFNKKSSQTQRLMTRGKNKGKNISTMVVLRRPHWVATYIDVPSGMVKMAKQNARNFSLELGV